MQYSTQYYVTMDTYINVAMRVFIWVTLSLLALSSTDFTMKYSML